MKHVEIESDPCAMDEEVLALIIEDFGLPENTTPEEAAQRMNDFQAAA